MRRRVLATALISTSLIVTTAAAAFSDGSANPGNSLTAASRFCPLDPTVTLAANADTYINSNAASTNYGTASTIEVGPWGVLVSLRTYRGLVRFNLPAVPNHCTLTGATMRLYNRGASGGRTIQVYRAAAAWGETTATWNNQPSETGSAASTSSGSGWQSWNVLGQIQAQYAGPNNGFLVRDSNDLAILSATQSYQSREGAPDSQDPQLVLSFGS